MELTDSRKNIHLSIVSPVYKAEHIVDELVKRITQEVIKITDSYEIVLVEDRGPDNSWEKILENCAKDSHVKGIRLSKNFGQHHAITAGLDHCHGDWIIVMDCDLQDRPEEIPKLHNEAIKGYDIVLARRVERQDNYMKKTSSKLFYKAFTYLSGIKQDGTVANYGIYSRKAINAINTLREPLRAFSAMASWVGFKKTSIDVVHGNRFEGATSYNWSRLMDFALDYAISYSQKPLKLTIKLGLSISLLSMVYAFVTIVRYLMGKISIQGYTSLIISIWFLSGLIIFILGIIGMYVGKTFEGIKNRPIYLIDEQINFE